MGKWQEAELACISILFRVGEIKNRLDTLHPQHFEAGYVEQDKWKKTAILVKQTQTEYPDVYVDVWTIDEHRQEEQPVLHNV